MKIKNKILLSVDESDLIDGHFENNEVTEIADECFYNLKGLKSVHLPKVKKIGDYCFSYNAAVTSISVPVLQTCGDYCFSDNAAVTSISVPVLQTCGDSCFRDNAAVTSMKIGKHNLTVKGVDGYCFVIENEKTSKGTKIYSGYNLVKIKDEKIEKHQCFVAEKDGWFAHGDTVKKAVEDLKFKIVADKLKKEPILPETLINVQYYRVVTGACELGCKDWMSRNGIKKSKMKAKELLPLLSKTSAYGVERFKQLCEWA